MMIRPAVPHLTAVAIFMFLLSPPGRAQHHPPGQANRHMHQRSFAELVADFENPGRNDWQQPEKVLDRLAPWRGRKVMDIGCGSGYFTFRLQERGASVIAADVDDRFLHYVDSLRASRNIGGDRLITRLLPYDDPRLDEGEVDDVLIVNTYHHIDDREKYFEKVRRGMRAGGRLIIIDFFQEKDIPVGPPRAMRISESRVKEELTRAGFRRTQVWSDLLPYQYLLIAYP